MSNAPFDQKYIINVGTVNNSAAGLNAVLAPAPPAGYWNIFGTWSVVNNGAAGNFVLTDPGGNAIQFMTLAAGASGTNIVIFASQGNLNIFPPNNTFQTRLTYGTTP